MYFVAVTSAVLQLYYYVSDLLTSACKHANNSLHQLYTTPTSLALQLQTYFRCILWPK